jgi:NAD(P)-dependent dehydrogenase (short-subunit alcohol dehydrogenase family)
VPPDRLAEAARSNRHLSRLERQRIATLHGRGLGVREIARRLDRSPSTISREVRRNLRPHDRDRYDGDLAHARARAAGRVGTTDEIATAATFLLDAGFVTGSDLLIDGGVIAAIHAGRIPLSMS